MAALWTDQGTTAVGGALLHERLGPVLWLLEWAVVAVDLCAILFMLVGALRFVGASLGGEMGSARGDPRRLDLARMQLGRYILGGLELLIVSDIIHTALSLRLQDLLFLGLLVLIRSVISLFLDRELAALGRDGGGGG